MNLTCPKCNHTWDYKGKNNRTLCGKCRTKGIYTIIYAIKRKEVTGKLVCSNCNHTWDYRGNKCRTLCGKCRKWVKTGLTSNVSTSASNISASTSNVSQTISPDFMSGSLIDALKKTGLDPMKNGQIRDAISSILEKDEYKIAWADALDEKKIDSIRLAKKILIDWLKKEEYV